MKNDRWILEKMIRKALTGEGAHVEAEKALEGLGWKMVGARPEAVFHSIYQQLNHLVYWQDWAVKWLDGKNPPIPKHASGSWPGTVKPKNRQEWERVLRRFKKGLKDLDRRTGTEDLFSKQRQKSRLEMLQTIASHNSYHMGQMVLMRQMLGAWPPPSGGLTW